LTTAMRRANSMSCSSSLAAIAQPTTMREKRSTRKTGSVATVCISAIKWGDGVNFVMSHTPPHLQARPIISSQGREPDRPESGDLKRLHSDGTTFCFFVIAAHHERSFLYGSHYESQMPAALSVRPERHIALLPQPVVFRRSALAGLNDTDLEFLEGVPAREAPAHIRKRRGARMRSLTLIYQGRLLHCSMVSSNLSAVSSAKSADICWANAVL